MHNTKDMNRSWSAFSFLNDEEIEGLLHPKSGYLARHLSSQPNQPKTQAERPTIVLDVDETILSACPWTLEISVQDIISKKCAPKELFKVVALVVEIATPTQTSTFVLRSQEDINQIFGSNLSKITSVVGVHAQSAQKQHEIFLDDLFRDFEPHFAAFDDLHAYNLRRPNVVPVSFFCEGLVVRLRPFLPTFLSFLRDQFDVILFTAAPKYLYTKVLRYVQQSLAPMLGKAKLWDKAFYREHCDISEDHAGYRKDIGKLGVDLSQIVIVDDNPESFAGYEPNAIQIGAFTGESYDDQLLRVMRLLQLVADSEDVRYPMCNLVEAPSRSRSVSRGSSATPPIDESCEWSIPNEGCTSLGRTVQFLTDLHSTYSHGLEVH